MYFTGTNAIKSKLRYIGHVTQPEWSMYCRWLVSGTQCWHWSKSPFPYFSKSVNSCSIIGITIEVAMGNWWNYRKALPTMSTVFSLASRSSLFAFCWQTQFMALVAKILTYAFRENILDQNSFRESPATCDSPIIGNAFQQLHME